MYFVKQICLEEGCMNPESAKRVSPNLLGSYLPLCHSAELSAPQRPVLPPDVHESPHNVVAAAGEGHERQAQGLLGGVQAAQGVGR